MAKLRFKIVKRWYAVQTGLADPDYFMDVAPPIDGIVADNVARPISEAAMRHNQDGIWELLGLDDAAVQQLVQELDEFKYRDIKPWMPDFKDP